MTKREAQDFIYTMITKHNADAPEKGAAERLMPLDIEDLKMDEQIQQIFYPSQFKPMRPRDVRTVSDFNKVLARAIEDQDMNVVDRLTQVSDNWLEMNDEKAARRQLLDAIYDDMATR